MTGHQSENGLRILITGSRNWPDDETIDDAIAAYADDTTFIMGDASGADTLARKAAIRMGFAVEMFKANWKRYGRRAGPDRNQRMVNSGVDKCLAFPEAGSKGTWDCVRRAADAGIPIEYPAGRP